MQQQQRLLLVLLLLPGLRVLVSLVGSTLAVVRGVLLLFRTALLRLVVLGGAR
jgi:hypothetical protein